MNIPTPSLIIDAEVVRRNIRRMADYARQHNLKLHPHTKTHKSALVGRLQMEAGAAGLTVAKPGEAKVMAEVSSDILLAYPTVDADRCAEMAELAKRVTVHVAIDSAFAADQLAAAARAAGSTIGILVDIDAGMHRTGVQSPEASLELAQHVARSPGLRLDGILFYPGHIHGPLEQQAPRLAAIDGLISHAIDLWKHAGLEAKIVSGSSTPTGHHSHLLKSQTHIRAGTYVYQDRNGILGGYCTLDDCAARMECTVVSTAVPGQVIIDGGTKTFTSDKSPWDPDGGHGLIVEYPQARIVKLTEEHGQVDITRCDRAPKLGERVHVVPNHICPCVNLHDRTWWKEPGQPPRPIPVDARGKVF
jgi:D-serine deaminase-like pyridoxal phosphate-dependent protein